MRSLLFVAIKNKYKCNLRTKVLQKTQKTKRVFLFFIVQIIFVCKDCAKRAAAGGFRRCGAVLGGRCVFLGGVGA
jgi:hypothetical protein